MARAGPRARAVMQGGCPDQICQSTSGCYLIVVGLHLVRAAPTWAANNSQAQCGGELAERQLPCRVPGSTVYLSFCSVSRQLRRGGRLHGHSARARHAGTASRRVGLSNDPKRHHVWREAVGRNGRILRCRSRRCTVLYCKNRAGVGQIYFSLWACTG